MKFDMQLFAEDPQGTPEDFYGTSSIKAQASDAAQSAVEIKAGVSNIIQVGKSPLVEEEQASVVPPVTEGAETPPEETKTDPPAVDVPEGHAPEVVEAQNTAKDIENDLTAKGVDFKVLETEYMDKGQFSEESLATLEKAGYPKSVVNAYITGLQATATKYHDSVLNLAGGAEAYAKATEDIKAKGPQYVTAFNEAINNGNLVVIESMIKNAQGNIQSRLGTAKASLLGTSGAPQAVPSQGFTSQKAMIEAINDPRYRSDVSYRKGVEARVAVTPF